MSGTIIKKGMTLLDIYHIESDPIPGGMGAVWKINHTGWNVQLAMKQPQIKMYLTDEQKLLFSKECESWINLGLHPHIVSCYYIRDINGIPSIFSEWMDGGSLRDYIISGKLYDRVNPVEHILDLAIQFARGLGYAHSNKLIHKDIKPDNLLLTLKGEAKIADFGGLHTTAYCSPEQDDKKEPTHKTDIYSWAVSLLEMFIGERLWKNGRIVGAAIEDYFNMEMKVSIPESLKNLIRDCVNENESRRPPDFDIIDIELTKIYKEVVGCNYMSSIPKAAADSADSLNNRALSYLDLGKPEDACDCWEKALNADPVHFTSTFNYALYQWQNAKISDEAALSMVDIVYNANVFSSERLYLYAAFCYNVQNYLKIHELYDNAYKGQDLQNVMPSVFYQALITCPEYKYIPCANHYKLLCIDENNILTSVSEYGFEKWKIGLYTFYMESSGIWKVTHKELLCISPNGNFALTCTDSIKKNARTNGQFKATFGIHNTSNDNCKLAEVDLNDGEWLEHSIISERGHAYLLFFSSSNIRIIHFLLTNKKIKSISIPYENPYKAILSTSGDFVFLLFDSGTKATLLSFHSRYKPCWVIDIEKSSGNHLPLLAFNRTCNRIAVACWDKIHIFDMVSAIRVKTLNTFLVERQFVIFNKEMGFTLDGKYIFLSGLPGRRFYEIETGRSFQTCYNACLFGITFSKSGRFIFGTFDEYAGILSSLLSVFISNQLDFTLSRILDYKKKSEHEFRMKNFYDEIEEYIVIGDIEKSINEINSIDIADFTYFEPLHNQLIGHVEVLGVKAVLSRPFPKVLYDNAIDVFGINDTASLITHRGSCAPSGFDTAGNIICGNYIYNVYSDKVLAKIDTDTIWDRNKYREETNPDMYAVYMKALGGRDTCINCYSVPHPITQGKFFVVSLSTTFLSSSFKVALVDSESGAVEKFFPLETIEIHSLNVDPEAKTLAVGYVNGELRLYDIDTGILKKKIICGGIISGIFFLYNGNILIREGLTDGPIKLYNSNDDCLSVFRSTQVFGLQVNKERNKALIAHLTKMEIYDFTNNSAKHFENGLFGLASCSFLPGEKHFVSLTAEGNLTFWEIDSGKAIFSTTVRGQGLSLSPCGNYCIITGLHCNKLRIVYEYRQK